MARFFETFEVLEGTGDWTKGPYPIDTVSHGYRVTMTDICAPASRPAPPAFDMGVPVHPFAVVGDLKVPTRCAPGELNDMAIDLMRDTTEYSVTQAMWAGAPDSPVGNLLYLKHADITEVPRVAGNYTATLADVLVEAYEQFPAMRPVVHLGWEAAIALQFGLQNLKLPYVVPPGYPKDAIAVTGPVRVRLSPITLSASVDTDVNRRYVEVTRFAAIEFDPFQAVRAADSV